jgi:phosphatidylglycerophosphatase C
MSVTPDTSPLPGLEGLKPGRPGRPLVAFDFDGTLTTRDSFTAFLRWRTTRARWALAGARLAPSVAGYAFNQDRGRLKAASVRIFLQGLTRCELEAEAEAFAQASFDRLLRPDALAAWAEYARKAVPRVIVTASPEEVVAPFARRLGAEHLIGTRLAWTPQGTVGGLDGPNCRGAEKVRRLQDCFGPDLDLRAAYGDTEGDREMLALADAGHMRVFRGRPANVSRGARWPSRPTGSADG